MNHELVEGRAARWFGLLGFAGVWLLDHEGSKNKKEGKTSKGLRQKPLHCPLLGESHPIRATLDMIEDRIVDHITDGHRALDSKSNIT